MRVLLVKDDAMIGNGPQQRLRQEGFIVVWLQDGEAVDITQGFGRMST